MASPVPIEWHALRANAPARGARAAGGGRGHESKRVPGGFGPSEPAQWVRIVLLGHRRVSVLHPDPSAHPISKRAPFAGQVQFPGTELHFLHKVSIGTGLAPGMGLLCRTRARAAPSPDPIDGNRPEPRADPPPPVGGRAGGRAPDLPKRTVLVKSSWKKSTCGCYPGSVEIPGVYIGFGLEVT